LIYRDELSLIKCEYATDSTPLYLLFDKIQVIKKASMESYWPFIRNSQRTLERGRQLNR